MDDDKDGQATPVKKEETDDPFDLDNLMKDIEKRKRGKRSREDPEWYVPTVFKKPFDGRHGRGAPNKDLDNAPKLVFPLLSTNSYAVWIDSITVWADVLSVSQAGGLCSWRFLLL